MSRNIPTRKVLTLTEKTLSPILFSLTAVFAVYLFDMRKFKVEYLGKKDQGFILIKHVVSKKVAVVYIGLT